MRLREFVESQADAQKLAALATFLSDRANDEAAAKQISKTTFIELARSVGVNVNDTNLNDIQICSILKRLVNTLRV